MADGQHGIRLAITKCSRSLVRIERQTTTRIRRRLSEKLGDVWDMVHRKERVAGTGL